MDTSWGRKAIREIKENIIVKHKEKNQIKIIQVVSHTFIQTLVIEIYQKEIDYCIHVIKIE